MKYIQKILDNEEALHLILAAFIGVLGGVVNLLFVYFVDLIQWFIFQKTGDSAFLARDSGPFLRVFVPMLGGILAGLILLFHTHLSGRKKLTNVLEVDGRLSTYLGPDFQSGMILSTYLLILYLSIVAHLHVH